MRAQKNALFIAQVTGEQPAFQGVNGVSPERCRSDTTVVFTLSMKKA
ncbi:hypothetical protein ACLB1N_10210 [Escherichia coli]